MPDTDTDCVIGDPLPKKPEITLKGERKVLYDGRLMLGDAVRAVALQSGMDALADYYFQENYVSPTINTPINDYVRQASEQLGYTCQVEGKLLRFRNNKWFIQPLMTQPDARLIDWWWSEIERSGSLSLNDVLDIACLPKEQMTWPGFRFVPNAKRAQTSPATMRLWRSLGPLYEEEARSPEGLTVARLPQDLKDGVCYWANLIGINSPPADMERAVITITEKEEPAKSYQFAFTMPNGQARSIQISGDMSPLDEAQRKQLALERRAEAEEEESELSPSK